MKKILGLLSIITILVLAISFVSTKSFAHIDTHEDNQCQTSCPVVHYEWDTESQAEGHYEYTDKIQVVDKAGHYECPGGQHLGSGNDSNKCYQNGNNSYKGLATWVDTTYKWGCPDGYSLHSNTCRKWVEGQAQTVHHSVDVVYDKSNDPNKCHRPSDSDLMNIYGMDHDTRLAFKSVNAEWKDSTVIVPEGYYNDGGKCYPKTPVCADDSATNYGGQDGQFDPNTEVANNDLCEYNNDGTPTPTPTGEVTPTPTNTPNIPGGGSDNLGCSVNDCSNQSHPTQAVLGLSTTSGESNIYFGLIQLASALALTGAGFKFFRKHA